MRKPTLAVRVAPFVHQSVTLLANTMGITRSEYLRRLIHQDLDSIKIFQEEFRRVIDQSFEEEDFSTLNSQRRGFDRTSRREKPTINTSTVITDLRELRKLRRTDGRPETEGD